MYVDKYVMALKLDRAEQQLEMLRQENAQLRRALSFDEPSFPDHLCLTRSETHFLHELMTCSVVSFDRALVVMPKVWKEVRSKRLVHVHACHLRKKLAAYGPIVEGVYNVGYRIRDENQKRLKAEFSVCQSEVAA